MGRSTLTNEPIAVTMDLSSQVFKKSSKLELIGMTAQAVTHAIPKLYEAGGRGEVFIDVRKGSKTGVVTLSIGAYKEVADEVGE